ncbi:MAG: MerR family transcriptional regulator, partial [Firmicutes bacterium]|nr:MerR family transcriptional regulator [Bacillota bacterium]
MKTIHEVSELAGISIRTLQYYDNIGLLHPSSYSDSGYRLYSDNDLEKLQQILLFRELEFPLKEIKEIINRPDFDRSKALEQQIQLLFKPLHHLVHHGFDALHGGGDVFSGHPLGLQLGVG